MTFLDHVLVLLQLQRIHRSGRGATRRSRAFINELARDMPSAAKHFLADIERNRCVAATISGLPLRRVADIGRNLRAALDMKQHRSLQSLAHQLMDMANDLDNRGDARSVALWGAAAALLQMVEPKETPVAAPQTPVFDKDAAIIEARRKRRVVARRARGARK